MMFNAAFSNISVISWPSVLLVEETVVPGEKHPIVQWMEFGPSQVTVLLT